MHNTLGFVSTGEPKSINPPRIYGTNTAQPETTRQGAKYGGLRIRKDDPTIMRVKVPKTLVSVSEPIPDDFRELDLDFTEVVANRRREVEAQLLRNVYGPLVDQVQAEDFAQSQILRERDNAILADLQPIRTTLELLPEGFLTPEQRTAITTDFVKDYLKTERFQNTVKDAKTGAPLDSQFLYNAFMGGDMQQPGTKFTLDQIQQLARTQAGKIVGDVGKQVQDIQTRGIENGVRQYVARVSPQILLDAYLDISKFSNLKTPAVQALQTAYPDIQQAHKAFRTIVEQERPSIGSGGAAAAETPSPRRRR